MDSIYIAREKWWNRRCRGKEGRRGGPAGSRVKAAPAHPAPSEGKGGGQAKYFLAPLTEKGREGTELGTCQHRVRFGEREREREREGGGCFPLSLFPCSVGRSVEGLKSMGEQASGSFSLSGEYKRRREGNKKAAQTIYDGMWVHLVGERERCFRAKEGMYCNANLSTTSLLAKFLLNDTIFPVSVWMRVQAVPRSAQLGSSWGILHSIRFLRPGAPPFL